MNDYEKQNQEVSLNKEQMKTAGLKTLASGAGITTAIYNDETDEQTNVSLYTHEMKG